METKQLHRGRLIDHVHLIARDLAASRRFYDAALGAIGRRWRRGRRLFLVGRAVRQRRCDGHHRRDPRPSRLPAADRAEVDRFHAAALAAGGQDHGKPGIRAEYHPGYYGAFVVDPDGNNIEAVYHGEADRSAASVAITFKA